MNGLGMRPQNNIVFQKISKANGHYTKSTSIITSEETIDLEYWQQYAWSTTHDMMLQGMDLFPYC